LCKNIRQRVSVRELGVMYFEVTMEYSEVESTEIPIQLLLEADPSEQSIRSYLNDSWCFVAKNDGQIVGACIVKLISAGTAEIFNVAVYPDHQNQGIGSGLLKFALHELANKRIPRVELGTGTFGYQLTYYQRIGFRVDSVVKEYFLANYPQPIFENGIQHKDMLRLYFEF
jgi:N-acetylglutamate synthase-like GNAT family acetyltransferase